MSSQYFVIFLFPLLTSSAMISDFQPVVLCEENLCPEVRCQDPVRSAGSCCPECPEIALVDTVLESCRHGEVFIEHGETFHPSSSNDSCSECKCLNGTIECTDVSDECPVLECDPAHRVVPEGSCCPLCSVCTASDGRIYHNGESWHPILPPFGEVPCINCICNDSGSKCEKLPCPQEPLPLCAPDEPIEEVTLCCKKCIRVPTTTVTTNAPITSELPQTISPPNIIPLSPSSENSTTATTPSQELNCMPKARTVGVWLHQTEDTVSLELTKGGKRSLELYSWRDIDETYSRKNESIDLMEEHLRFSTDEYNFKGWALTRRFNALSTNPRRIEALHTCDSECAQLVVHYLRPVLFDLGCEQ